MNRKILFFDVDGTIVTSDHVVPESARAALEATGCDGVAVARAALGDPWLFERINAALEGRPAQAAGKAKSDAASPDA